MTHTGMRRAAGFRTLLIAQAIRLLKEALLGIKVQIQRSFSHAGFGRNIRHGSGIIAGCAEDFYGRIHDAFSLSKVPLHASASLLTHHD